MGAGTAALNHSPGPVELAAERQRRNRRPASDQETGLGMEGIAHDWFLLTISPGGPEAAWDARGSGNTPYLFTFSSSHPVGRRPTFAHLLSAHRSPLLCNFSRWCKTMLLCGRTAKQPADVHISCRPSAGRAPSETGVNWITVPFRPTNLIYL